MSEAILRTALEQMLSEFDADEFSSEGQMAVCYEARQALAALDSRAGDAANGNDACVTESICKTGSPWPASSSEPRLPSSSCGFVEQSADRAGDAGEDAQAIYERAQRELGFSPRSKMGGLSERVTLHAIQIALSATPAPAVDAQASVQQIREARAVLADILGVPVADAFYMSDGVFDFDQAVQKVADLIAAPAVDAVPAGEGEP